MDVGQVGGGHAPFACVTLHMAIGRCGKDGAHPVDEALITFSTSYNMLLRTKVYRINHNANLTNYI